jgi:hypothetical protein
MSQSTKAPQKERVLKLLQAGKALTQAQARATYRIASLSSRVNELRRAGVPITSTPFRHRNGRVVVRYEMAV